MTKVLDGVLVFILNFLLNVEVNGSVWRHTIVPLSTPTVQKFNKYYSQESKQPDWEKIIFMKNLLELQCLRDNFKRIQRDRRLHSPDSQPQIPIYIEKDNFQRPISANNKNDNLKRRRYSGENEKIILAPAKQGESGFPIYIYNKPQLLTSEQFRHLNKELQIKKTNLKPKLNETGKQDGQDEGFKSASREPIIGNKTEINSKMPTLLNSKENKLNNQIFDGSSRDRSKVSSGTVKAPAKNLLPLDKFLKFMETIQSLSSTSVKNASRGAQTLNSHTVKENNKKNIQNGIGKNDPSTKVRKPQDIVGGYHLPSQIPKKPKHQEPFEILRDSINQILKNLLGSEEDETPKNHINGNLNQIQKVRASSGTNKITLLDEIQNLKRHNLFEQNIQPQPFEYPERRRYFNEIQTNIEQPFYPKTFSDSLQNSPEQHELQRISPVSRDTFKIYKPISDNQRLTEPERTLKTTISTTMTFTPKSYLSNNSSPNHKLTTKATGRQLKFPEIANAFNISNKLSSKPMEDVEDVSQQRTTPEVIEVDQSTELQETTLANSISSDNESSTNVFESDFVSTSQTDLDSPGLALQELALPTSESPIYMETTSTSSSTSFETISNLTTTVEVEVKGNQNTEESTITSTTSTSKEYTEGPMAFDLLITTNAESHLKNQENPDKSWKNGRKINLNADAEMPEITNFLFNGTEQRRSDILINDAPEDYDQSQSEMEPFNYMKKLKEILLTSDFTIDDIIFIIPWVVDDLRQNKIQSDDIEFLSKAFGKYWQDILALSKDSNLDMLPLMKVAKEKDLKKLFDNFLPKRHPETTTVKNTIEITEKKMVDAPAYDYLEDYQDFYENIVGQTLEKRKNKLLRSKREKSFGTLMTELMRDMTENSRPTKRIQKDADEDMLKIEATKEYFEALEEENSQIQNEDRNYRNYIYEDIIYDELSEILESSDFSVAESKKLSYELLNENHNKTRK